MNSAVPSKLQRIHDDGRKDNFVVEKKLGHGSFGTVFQILNVGTGKRFALKAISLDFTEDPDFKSRLDQEIAIQESLNHQNVLKLYDHFEDDFNSYLVLELCTNQSVETMLKRKGTFSEIEASELLYQIIDGVSYLHENQVLHRDLKLENFLIGDDGKIKIADFGISTRIEKKKRRHSICGTVGYLSPEVVSKAPNGYSFESDIWAIGVGAFIMLVGHPPFDRRNKNETYECIKNCNYSFPNNISLSFVAKDFIQSILQVKPEARPHASDLLKHPFILQSQNVKKSVIPKAKQVPEIIVPKVSAPQTEQLPTYLVSRYYDKNQNVGLIYLLMDGTVGAVFTDFSRMVIDPYETFIHYYANYQVSNPQIIEKDDQKHAKKVSILTKYATLLKKDESYFELPHPEPNDVLRHVKYWIKSEHGIMFRTDDRVIQLNFADKRKLVIFWEKKKIYLLTSEKKIETARTFSEIKQRNKGDEDICKRFSIALKMIDEMNNQ
ncbi:CAMK family protein kinase [Histomonas meleagridis]|uniref:CAMK family protein kinase n=1 Tax=Histomonas meleagridis TaxID=135588 RepID=UPI00355A2A31|nr:CAMK family protein kinase [Histomonas meleagridis]KAH0801280.1 CAMK family protein kinase [Histomonas meleagridis]